MFNTRSVLSSGVILDVHRAQNLLPPCFVFLLVTLPRYGHILCCFPRLQTLSTFMVTTDIAPPRSFRPFCVGRVVLKLLHSSAVIGSGFASTYLEQVSGSALVIVLSWLMASFNRHSRSTPPVTVPVSTLFAFFACESGRTDFLPSGLSMPQAVELGTIEYVNIVDGRHGDMKTALALAAETGKPLFCNFVEWSG